jgi:hypothetical protein
MSKKMINILATLMAIAVAAMVWVQVITINKTGKLQESNFNIIVNRALADVNDMLVFQETNLRRFAPLPKQRSLRLTG